VRDATLLHVTSRRLFLRRIAFTTTGHGAHGRKVEASTERSTFARENYNSNFLVGLQ